MHSICQYISSQLIHLAYRDLAIISMIAIYSSIYIYIYNINKYIYYIYKYI